LILFFEILNIDYNLFLQDSTIGFAFTPMLA